jgi:hypothetical protein
VSSLPQGKRALAVILNAEKDPQEFHSPQRSNLSTAGSLSSPLLLELSRRNYLGQRHANPKTLAPFPTTQEPRTHHHPPSNHHKLTSKNYTKKRGTPGKSQPPPLPVFNPEKPRIQLDSTPFPSGESTCPASILIEIMSTSTLSSSISADEFQALEQKVLRAVEIVKREREARAAAEAEVASLREQLAAFESNTRAVEAELSTLNKERDAVRLRVEKMLQQMDELL